LKKFCTRFDFDSVTYALSGGEDYTLLCTAAADTAEKIASDFQNNFNRPLFALGRITDTQQMDLMWPDGRIRSFAPSGWDHFKGVDESK
jgi:thiamine monophosphate kinase